MSEPMHDRPTDAGIKGEGATDGEALTEALKMAWASPVADAAGLRTEMEGWRSEANRLREELEEAIASRDALHDEVARLKDVARSTGIQPMKDAERAEAELVRLRDEAGRLRTALAPFARAWNEQEPDSHENDVLEMHVRPSDCRKAAEVLDAQEDAPR